MATRIFLPHTRFTPTQKIRTEPIMETFHRAASVISGCISRASTVTRPCHRPTGMAENRHPLPIAQVIIKIIIKSKTALAASTE